MSSNLSSEYSGSKDLVFGRTVVPVVNPNKKPKKDKLGFEYAEHCFIGDAITLTLASDRKVAASDHKLKLSEQLSLTYGQINGLAGDFYGTYNPISDGKDVQDQSARFVQAYNTLATVGPQMPQEAVNILGVLQMEVDAINEALANHQDPSVVYAKLPDVTWKLELMTAGRSGIPGYLGLAAINWDHFGEDARTVYNTGHATAIQKAISGDLEGAYAMNAFADHFLEDSFSAGHLRTPRRYLHGTINYAADVCAKLMHDEDNAIGISVEDPEGQSWTLYGDKRALDSVDEDNKTRCVKSVQASADEIYQAYQTRLAPSPANYQAWTYAPTLESARAHQTLATLFTFNEERRKVITKRRLWELKTDWWFATTVIECKTSGRWNYPITIDGEQSVVPWSSVAVTPTSQWHICVYYQRPGGGIIESKHHAGTWVGGPTSSPIFKARLFTPLAAISFNGGKEIRVYYLDEQYFLQEYCYSADKGYWFPGSLGSVQIQAATNTSIAAVQFGDDPEDIHIRVYYQDLASDAIKQLCYDGYWSKGRALPVALSGSSLTVIACLWGGVNLRLYYQTDDLSIKEHCFGGSGWFPGEGNFGKAPGCVPISAFGHAASTGLTLYVYWRNLQNEIIGMKYAGSWGSIGTVVRGLKPGTNFAAAQWNDGKNPRIYFQNHDDSILEMCNDGSSWYSGAIVGKAH